MLQTIPQLVRSEPLQVVVELVVIWLCVSLLFRFLRETRGAGAMKGFVVLLVVATLIVRLLDQGTGEFSRLSFIYSRFLTVITVMLVVVFQPELRQAMIRLGQAWSFRTDQAGLNVAIESVSEAVMFLSKAQFGALIAIERGSRLGGLAKSGMQLDAQLSPRLLESIFWPNSPLHDLGVVIRGDRIVAASVQFPLAEEGALSQRFGSRHRAAVGLATESDCLIVIVSEETGAISIAEQGQLEHGISRDDFRDVLAQRLQAQTPESDNDDDDDNDDITDSDSTDSPPTSSASTSTQSID